LSFASAGPEVHLIIEVLTHHPSRTSQNCERSHFIRCLERVDDNRPTFVLCTLNSPFILQMRNALEAISIQNDAMSLGVHARSNYCASRHTAGAEDSHRIIFSWFCCQ
jgi:hypothetical protein